MLIQYASDLHLEFLQNKKFLQTNPLVPRGDILILAGDIVPFCSMKEHSDFFNQIADHFQTIYWIPGNHEYYHSDLAVKSGILNEAIRSNVFLVNNISIAHENFRFIFSTMWSKINPTRQYAIERSINDFNLIRYNGRRFSADDFNCLHDEAMLFLRETLETPSDKTTIVATHHVPTFLNYPLMYKGDVLNDAFAVELFDLIDDSGPDYWIYGHHHFNQPDFQIGHTRLLTNQVGYVQNNEHRLFDSKRCIASEDN